MTAYTCEPEKNKACPKTHCWWNGGECTITTRREFAVDSEQKKPKPWCCHKVCPHVGNGVSCEECYRIHTEGKE